MLSRTNIKWIILCSVLYAILMVLHWPIGFTFFTLLSNIFSALTVFLQMLSGYCKNPERFSGLYSMRSFNDLYIMKYMSVVSITVTFLIYVMILATLTPGGFAAAYSQDHYASFFLHVVTPILMLTDFFVNDRGHDWDTVHAWWGLLPPAGYLVFIIVLGRCGFTWFGTMKAPYPFLNYAAPAGWFGFLPETAGRESLGIGVFYMIIAMIIVVWGVSCVILCRMRRFSATRMKK